MQFLTPGFFDALVVITIVIAVLAVVLRLYHDFRLGPRSEPSQPQSAPPDQADQQEKPVDD